MKSLENVLKKIKYNPEKYLGKKSLKRLSIFIVGYALCQRDELGKDSKSLIGFQEFVEKKYNITYTKRWAEIIDFFSESDEQAFDNFYCNLEEFYGGQ